MRHGSIFGDLITEGLRQATKGKSTMENLRREKVISMEELRRRKRWAREGVSIVNCRRR